MQPDRNNPPAVVRDVGKRCPDCCERRPVSAFYVRPNGQLRVLIELRPLEDRLATKPAAAQVHRCLEQRLLEVGRAGERYPAEQHVALENRSVQAQRCWNSAS